jgi:hypothetical protein
MNQQDLKPGCKVNLDHLNKTSKSTIKTMKASQQAPAPKIEKVIAQMKACNKVKEMHEIIWKVYKKENNK